MQETLETLKRAIEHAPKSPGILADGWYVCAKCAGRIMGRGCNLPSGVTPVWREINRNHTESVASVTNR